MLVLKKIFPGWLLEIKMHSRRFSIVNYNYTNDKAGLIENNTALSEFRASWQFSVPLDLLSKINTQKKEVNYTDISLSAEEFKKACEDMLNYLKDALDRFGLHPRFEDLFYFTLYHRIRIVLEKVNIGISIEEALAPYRLSDKKTYENHQLFKEMDEKIKKECSNKLIQYFSEATKRGYFLGNHTQEGLDIILRYDPNAEKYLELFPNLLKAIATYTNDLTNVEQFLRDQLPDYYWPVLESKLLTDVDKLKKLQELGYLFVLLKVLVEKRKNLNEFLLSHIDVVNTLGKILRPEEFVFFTRMLNLENKGKPLYPEANFNAAEDFFKVLLINGFDFKPCARVILANFALFQRESSAMLYESLTAGEKSTAQWIIEALNSYEVKRVDVNANENQRLNSKASTLSLFSNSKMERVQEITTFKESVTYSTRNLLEYMRQKYKLAKNPAELYFMSQPNDFVETLCKNGLINRGSVSEFKRVLTQQFSIQFVEDKTNSNVSDNLEKEVELLKKRNEELEQRVNLLEKIMSELLQDQRHSLPKPESSPLNILRK